MAIEAIEKLTTQLAKLPGVGRKTASRFAYHLLAAEEDEAEALANAILEARQLVHHCPRCGMYTDGELCEFCADPRRSDELLCVVSDPKDVLAMEKTHAYMGRYHVLMGALSPMDGIGPADLSIDELLRRLQAGQVREVILATDSDVKGDVTASYLAKLIKPLNVKVTRIARGIPIGGNLEYTDEVTLTRALEGRQVL